jgi:[ribosomal protein S5]-alanine N-acetyltransferase
MEVTPMTMHLLTTQRMELVPMTLQIVEAVFADNRSEVARLVNATLPDKWPGRALIERAFSASLDHVRADPAGRLWGDRLMITREDRKLVGSVVFHGAPIHGEVEVGYGVEASSQGLGYGTEATCALVDWALSQQDVTKVSATTLPWHKASIRILQRAGLRPCGWREHELLGDLQVFERLRVSVEMSTQPRFVEHRSLA